jgi:hypothetical protein
MKKGVARQSLVSNMTLVTKGRSQLLDFRRVKLKKKNEGAQKKKLGVKLNFIIIIFFLGKAWGLGCHGPPKPSPSYAPIVT